jgi:hypothetical protein
VLGCVLLLAAAGCRPQLAAITGDTTLALSRQVAQSVLVALSARVSNPLRDAKYDSARFRIARAAFLPSRIWNDTSVWSASTAVRRTLFVSGQLTGGRYRLEATRALTPITQLGDLRHTIRLTRLSSDEYSWDTDIQYAIGPLMAANSGALLSAILSSAEGLNEPTLRAEYRMLLPAATAAFGQLFSIDSVRTTRLADGSTAATIAIRMTPRGIRDRYPKYADYLERYASSTAMHWSVLDRNGASYLTFASDDGHLSLRVRSRAGALLALIGPARPLPDTLVLAGAMTVNVHHVTMGFTNYHADLYVTRTPHERALTVVTRREPDWVLPLVAERLLRTPLRRPFQGNGSLYRIGVRDDSTPAHALLTRRMHLEVQESPILRFVGRLGGAAVTEYDSDVERQGDRWMHDALGALAIDLGAARPD